jgi:hypothetical protein
VTAQPDPQLIAAVDAIYRGPTAYRDDTAVPAYGPTPAVAQPDSRRIPAWASGIAVASIGVGAGATGIGCAVWLAMKGLSMATLNGVLMIAAPFAGVALVAVVIGGLLRSLRGVHTETHHHYTGPVDQRTVHSKTTGLWARTNNEQ